MPRIILVTGGSRGLGLAISKLFLNNNDIVYIAYCNHLPEHLTNPNAHLIKCDITKEEEIINMINQIKEEVGKIDVLINNAGIAIDTLVEDKTKSNFMKILDTNLIGPFLVTKYASKIMLKGSNIINISSTNGIDTYYPYSLDYDASKAGLINLTHNLAEYFAPNIRVNTVAPGWIETDMNKNLDAEFMKEEKEKIMLGRFAKPIEIAKVVYFLASPDASYINSTVIRVDGGLK